MSCAPSFISAVESTHFISRHVLKYDFTGNLDSQVWIDQSTLLDTHIFFHEQAIDLATYITYVEEYEELNDLYSSPNIVRVIKSRRMRWAGHVARMEEGRGVHKVLVGKPEGKRPLRRPRRRWEDNIKMDLEEVGRGCGEWMELAQDRKRWRVLVSTVMNLRVP